MKFRDTGCYGPLGTALIAIAIGNFAYDWYVGNFDGRAKVAIKQKKKKMKKKVTAAVTLDEVVIT